MKLSECIAFFLGVRETEGDIKLQGITGFWVQTSPESGERILVASQGNSLKLGEIMPALRKYTVTQEREVKVSATNPVDAANLAQRVLSATKKPEDQINVIMWPVERTLEVREEY